jgi:hypothetical protein
MTLQSAGTGTVEIAALGPWFHNLHLPGGEETAPDHPLGDFLLHQEHDAPGPEVAHENWPDVANRQGGHRCPDGDSAGNESGDEIDGAMPPKPFSIAVYRASSLISRGFEAPYGSSANQ